MPIQGYPDPGEGLRLHLNENTGGCSAHVLEAIRQARAEDVTTYPEYTKVVLAVARYFDVDWQPPEAYLRDRILLPILRLRLTLPMLALRCCSDYYCGNDYCHDCYCHYLHYCRCGCDGDYGYYCCH